MALPTQAGAEGPLLQQLWALGPLEGQGLVGVVGGQVPGIPKLAAVGEAPPAQGRRQQLRAPKAVLAALQLVQPLGPQPGPQLAVLQ